MQNASDAAGSPRPRARRLTRRGLFRAAIGTLASGSAVGIYARFVEPFWPRVSELPMEFARVPHAPRGLRLVQISDLHVSSYVPESYLRQQLRRASAMRPDLICVTGDMLTDADTQYLDVLRSLIGELRAPLGVFAVLGNHDYNVYLPPERTGEKALGEVGDRVEAALRAGGAEVLRNRCVRVTAPGGALQLVGVDDLWSGFYDPRRAFAGADASLPTITLAHNPDTIDELRHAPTDWILSGHTHGGQVRVPLLGAPILPTRHRELDAGEFEIDGRRMYVNSGLGYLRQVRFNCRPEITVFTVG